MRMQGTAMHTNTLFEGVAASTCICAWQTRDGLEGGGRVMGHGKQWYKHPPTNKHIMVDRLAGMHTYHLGVLATLSFFEGHLLLQTNCTNKWADRKVRNGWHEQTTENSDRVRESSPRLTSLFDFRVQQRRKSRKIPLQAFRVLSFATQTVALLELPFNRWCNGKPLL